jgi:hypothetical protein
MVFEVYKYYADTCGNEDSYLMGYCEFKSEKEATKFFGRGFLVGVWVRKLVVSSKSEILRRIREHKE